MSEMSIRVAKIFADDRCGGGTAPCSIPNENCSCWELARAAIEAMREPTEEMKEQIGWAYAIMVAAGRLPRDEDLSDENEELFWQVAIDEALK